MTDKIIKQCMNIIFEYAEQIKKTSYYGKTDEHMKSIVTHIIWAGEKLASLSDDVKDELWREQSNQMDIDYLKAGLECSGWNTNIDEAPTDGTIIRGLKPFLADDPPFNRVLDCDVWMEHHPRIGKYWESKPKIYGPVPMNIIAWKFKEENNVK